MLITIILFSITSIISFICISSYTFLYYKKLHSLGSKSIVVLSTFNDIIKEYKIKIIISKYSVLSYNLLNNTVTIPEKLYNGDMDIRNAFFLMHELGHYYDLNQNNVIKNKIYIMLLTINRLLVIPLIFTLTIIALVTNSYNFGLFLTPYFFFITIIRLVLGPIQEEKASKFAINILTEVLENLTERKYIRRLSIANTIVQLSLTLMILVSVITLIMLQLNNY